jgi:hypothetical protein
MPESSIEGAVAAAEQDGLRFLLRVRLVVLAAVALYWFSDQRDVLAAALISGAD